jgi:hypothetical protein
MIVKATQRCEDSFGEILRATYDEQYATCNEWCLHSTK